MGPVLCERRGGAQLNGLRLVKDHRGQRLLPQRQHIQLRFQHGLEVLMEKESQTWCFKKTDKCGPVVQTYVVYLSTLLESQKHCNPHNTLI